MTILTAQRLRQLASWPHLEDTWWLVTGAVMTVCNRPEEIGRLYEHAQQVVPDVDITAKLREALLKTAALSGLPRSINALRELQKAVPTERWGETRRPVVTTWQEWQQVQERGEEYWGVVYGKVSQRVKGQLQGAYGDLWEYTLRDVYGPLLSYDGVLDAQESAICVVSALIPQQVNAQLKGHLKGALNVGVRVETVREVRKMAILLSQWGAGGAAAGGPRDADVASV